MSRVRFTSPGFKFRDVEALIKKEYSWLKLDDGQRASYGSIVALASPDLYVLGGTGDIGLLKYCWRLDLTTMTWYRLSDMPKALGHAPAVSYTGKIYVFGGLTEAGPTDSIFVYDTAGDSWTEYAGKLPLELMMSGACIADNIAYVAGGYDSFGNPVSNFFSVDLDTLTVTSLADMPTARANLGVAYYQGKVYAIGGDDGTKNLDRVEVYDPSSGTWEQGTSLPVEASGIVAFTLNIDGVDKIVVVGI